MTPSVTKSTRGAPEANGGERTYLWLDHIGGANCRIACDQLYAGGANYAPACPVCAGTPVVHGHIEGKRHAREV